MDVLPTGIIGRDTRLLLLTASYIKVENFIRTMLCANSFIFLNDAVVVDVVVVVVVVVILHHHLLLLILILLPFVFPPHDIFHVCYFLAFLNSSGRRNNVECSCSTVGHTLSFIAFRFFKHSMSFSHGILSHSRLFCARHISHCVSFFPSVTNTRIRCVRACLP